MNKLKIIFITASHIRQVLDDNLLKSKIISKENLIIKKDYQNISKAYNEINSDANIFVYIHHDVFLPDDLESNLIQSLNKIEKNDPNWGVLGVAGASLSLRGKNIYGYLLDRGKIWKCKDPPTTTCSNIR